MVHILKRAWLRGGAGGVKNHLQVPQVRRQLGYADPQFSYVQLLASQVFGITLSQTLADWLAGVVFGLILVATALVWARGWYRRHGLVSAA